MFAPDDARHAVGLVDHRDDSDCGNSLVASLEYLNGAMIYNERRNKVGAVPCFSHDAD